MPRSQAAEVTSGTGNSGARAQTDDREALTTALKDLFSEWKAIPVSQLAGKAPAVKDRIDTTLTSYVTKRLSERPRSLPRGLQRDLNRAITAAVWESVYGLSPDAVMAAQSSKPPRRWAFVVKGSGSTSNLYVAAFAIGYGNVFTTRIHGFAPNTKGTYLAVGPVGELDGMVSGIVRLNPFRGGLRFILWSLHIGSPEALTTVAFYGFNGKNLEALWSRQNVPNAKVGLQRGFVVIESHTHLLTKKGTIFRYRRIFYHQVPGGLKAVKTDRWVEH